MAEEWLPVSQRVPSATDLQVSDWTPLRGVTTRYGMTVKHGVTTEGGMAVKRGVTTKGGMTVKHGVTTKGFGWIFSIK